MARKRINWRVQSAPDGSFDEIVVGTILHAEMLSKRECFINVAGMCFWVCVDDDGRARIIDTEDQRKIRKII